VLGCVAQQEGQRIFERSPHVGLVVGSASYAKLPELLIRIEAGERRVTGLSLDTEEAFETPFTRRDNPHRAYITIIEGCDKSCAYCVVPFTRGPERSRTGRERDGRSPATWPRPAGRRSSLLGQNVNSVPRSNAGGLGFRASAGGSGRRRRHPPRALHHLAPARFRERRSWTPWSATRRCDHVHLPVQSGSTKVLAGHGSPLHARRVHAPHRVDQERRARAIAISTDIIVGFPGETEEDFAETLSLLDQVEYDSIFSFKYSPRPNTPAFALADQVPDEEKQAAA
jgi:tRNA-2-methylthio-N6-dimethylallyladenosine synthase